MTIPLQKLILLLNGFWLSVNPAKYATVIGKSESEQGPKLVKKPPRKTMNIESALGVLRPLLINISLLRAKSDKIKLIEEMFKKGLASLSSTTRLST